MPAEKCPSCGEMRLYRISEKGARRVLFRAVSVRRLRCHACNARSWRLRGKSFRPVTAKQRKRAMFAAAVVLAVGALTGLTAIYLAGP